MSRRSRAREIVLQVLYEDDLNPSREMSVADAFLAKRLNHEPELIEFAHGLLSGVRRNRSAIDQALKVRAENWSISRMAVIDRNILRLGAYEILHTETPNRVVINEAVELAKRFGAKQSPTFVNGILDRLLRDQEPNPEGEPSAHDVSSPSAAPKAPAESSAPLRRVGSGPLAIARREPRGGND